MLTYALGVGLGSMLALGAAAYQVRTDPLAVGQVTQYCAPPHDYPDAHRFYCRDADGWSCPTGVAASSCFMQEIEEMMRSWSLRLNDGAPGPAHLVQGPIWHFHKTFGMGRKIRVKRKILSGGSFRHPHSSQRRESVVSWRLLDSVGLATGVRPALSPPRSA